MRRIRVGGLLGGLAFCLLLAVEPVAAQVSANEELIWGLNNKLLYVAIPITILVELILIYTVWRFRESNQEEASPTQENRRLEITWTVATAVILLFVGFASYQVLASPFVAFVGDASADADDDAGEVANLSRNVSGAVPPQEADALQVEVVAYKYAWEFRYPESDVTSTNELVLPTDRPVYLHVVSQDWMHAIHVPQLAIKQDAFPGHYNTVKTEVYETGTYQLYCAEYCGVGHSDMLATVEVVPQGRFQQWLQDQQGGSNGGNGTATPGSANGTATPGSGNGTVTPGSGNGTTNGTA